MNCGITVICRFRNPIAHCGIPSFSFEVDRAPCHSGQSLDSTRHIIHTQAQTHVLCIILHAFHP